MTGKEYGCWRKVETVLPPIQPDITFHTIDHEECLKSLAGTTNKSMAFFYQFTVGHDAEFMFLPEGCINFVFNCTGDTTHSKILGVHTKPEVLQLTEGTTYFGVKLYSTFGMSKKFGNLNEMVDVTANFHEIFPGIDLPERIAESGEFEEGIKVFEKYHNKAVNHAYYPGLEEACAIMLCKSGGNIQIDDLERETGYTKRHIQKKFSDHYGISPKLYGMIKRYQGALSMYLRNKEMASFIALENGYCDQSHFIKDFKRFTGCSPEHYVSELHA